MTQKVLSIVLASALVGTMMAQEVEHRKEVYVIKAGKASGINTATPSEQKEIGKAVMEFMYDYKYLTDTTDVSQTETDRMTLQVTYGMSKFTSFRAMQIDSLIRVSTAEQAARRLASSRTIRRGASPSSTRFPRTGSYTKRTFPRRNGR